MSQTTAMEIERIASGRDCLFCIAASATVAEAALKMSQNHVGCLIVTEGDPEAPAGILTERDILRRAVAQGRDPFSLNVSAIMSANVIHCSPDASVAAVQQIMAMYEIRHVPLIMDGEIVGIVTSRDIHAYELGNASPDVVPPSSVEVVLEDHEHEEGI